MPGVEALQLGQALHVRVDEPGEPVQVGRATVGAERGPRAERAGRGAHREVDLGGATPCHLRDDGPVDGRDVGEVLAAVHAPAADVVSGRHGDAHSLATVSRSSIV